MNDSDWKDFLRNHPLFEGLNKSEIERLIESLLDENVSNERVFLRDRVIIREGELGDSLFLIRTGSVQVILHGEGGYEIILATLREGDFFGEMSLFERKQRSATVIARENCTLREIKGQEFERLLARHADIELKVLLKLSERLRRTNEQVLTVTVKNVDERLNLFGARLDTELKAADASLRASQTVLASAERFWTRLTTCASIFLGVITTAIALFTWLGISRFVDVTQLANQVEAKATIIENAEKRVETFVQELSLLDEVKMNFNEEFVWPRFRGLLEKVGETNNTPEFDEALSLYELLLKADDDKLFLEIQAQMEYGEKKAIRAAYMSLLKASMDNDLTPRNRIVSYYLFLTALILDNKYKEKEFKNNMSEFEEYVKEYREGKRPSIKEYLKSIKIIFDRASFTKDSEEIYKKVKKLIP